MTEYVVSELDAQIDRHGGIHLILTDSQGVVYDFSLKRKDAAAMGGVLIAAAGASGAMEAAKVWRERQPESLHNLIVGM